VPAPYCGGDLPKTRLFRRFRGKRYPVDALPLESISRRGLRLGLGRNVIWMCNHSEVNDLHFDTRQFSHILYDDLAKAKGDLVNKIVALEGPGTYVEKKSNPTNSL
jgi:hypothetical protein